MILFTDYLLFCNAAICTLLTLWSVLNSANQWRTLRLASSYNKLRWLTSTVAPYAIDTLLPEVHTTLYRFTIAYHTATGLTAANLRINVRGVWAGRPLKISSWNSVATWADNFSAWSIMSSMPSSIDSMASTYHREKTPEPLVVSNYSFFVTLQPHPFWQLIPILHIPIMYLSSYLGYHKRFF